MLIIAALIQTLPVPDPVPNIVMTRREVDATSDVALETRLLSGTPHGRITRIDRPRDSDGIPGQPERALDYIIFHEAGTPSNGSLCRARQLHVTFDTLDGRVSPPANAGEDATAAPRRVFRITPYPTVAIVAGSATRESCAAAPRYVLLPPREPDKAVAMVEMLRAGLRGARGGPSRITCFDDTAKPPAPCDPSRAGATIDWAKLISVSSTQFTGEPPTWRVQVGATPGVWTFSATPDGSVESGRWQVDMRRGYPPPF
ncbi:MAG TPA: hypothetical protein VF695_06770 [Sphingomonas sp.]|jgi:hypothetical protein